MQGRLDPYTELRAQLEKVLQAGIPVTHFDSHKHTHIVPRVFRAVVRLAHEFKVPYVRLPLDTALRMPRATRRLLRRFYERMSAAYQVSMTDHFLGFRLTGSLTEETLAVALRTVQEGTTELMCHPGLLGSELQSADTRLKGSRVKELEALTSPRIRRVMDELSIHLGPFAAGPEQVHKQFSRPSSS